MVFTILYDFSIHKWINDWRIIFMTEKRFRLIDYEDDYFTVGDDEKGEEYDTPFKVVNVLNELNNENKQLRKFIMDLQNMIQFDVDNGIKTYPIKLSEYLANVLKEICND